jgi:DNA-binding IscR family transcriptional regulator
LLKQAGLIASQQGKSGFYLVKEPADISLKEVYQAVYPEKTLLHVHEDANPNCPVGSRIEQVLSPVFEDAEASLLNRLNQENLSDLITDMYKIN